MVIWVVDFDIVVLGVIVVVEVVVIVVLCGRVEEDCPGVVCKIDVVDCEVDSVVKQDWSEWSAIPEFLSILS